MKRYCLLFVVLLLVVLTVACRDEEVAPTAVSQPIIPLATLSPTATLLPTPTIAATATSVPTPDALEVTVSNEDDLDSFLPDAPFSLQFNQPMETDSVRLPLLVSPFLEGTISWNDDGTHLSYLPEGGFAPDKAYTIVLDGGVTAVSGQTFSQPQQWQIRAAPAPRVTSRDPASRLLETRHPTIQLTFSQTMDKDSVAEALRVEPDIRLNLDWKETTLTIEPAAAMQPGTTYYFTLARTAASGRGVAMTGDYTWSHRPSSLIVYTTLPNEQRRRSNIAIQFSYEMDTESVRRAISFKPAIVGDLTWNEENDKMTFTPAAPLATDTAYTISFDEPIFDANGDALPAPDPIQFTTPPPILGQRPEGRGIHPATTVEVTFDRPMDEAATAVSFRITPDVAGNIKWRETSLVFTADEGYLAEYTDYTVTIDTAAAGADGEPLLNQPYTWTFSTGALDDIANFGWGPNAQVVDVDGRRAIQYQLFQTNASNITFELYRLNLTQFLDRYSSGFRGAAGWEDERLISTADAPLTKSWTIQPGESSAPTGSYVHELIIPQDVPTGLYILNLKVGHVNAQLILLLSRNTIAVKQAEGQIVAWVTDINGGPKADMEVAVYARDGQLISNGRSDQNGIFRTTVTTDPQPLIVIAGDGDDVTASGLSNEWRTGRNSWWGWWRPSPAARDYAAYIYTDRPIYRPGQQMFFKAIIRRDDDAILDILPADTAVTARIRDARNNVVQTFDLTTNHFGTVNGAFQIGDGAMLGQYAVEIVLDGENYRQVFKVEDYRKPDYQVTVNSGGGRFIEGDKIEVTVDTAYFFGQPVPNADIVINLFELARRYWWNEDGGEDYIWFQSYEPVKRGQTDANGRFTFILDAELGYRSESLYWRSNLEQSIWAIEATVDDGSHQTVSGFSVIRVFNAAEKVRLDTNGYAHEPGQPFTVQAEVMDIFDRPVNGRILNLTLRRWRRGSSGYDTVVQSAQLTSDGNGRTRTQFTIAEPGFYQLRLTSADRLGNEMTYKTYVYAFSKGYSSWYGRSSGLAINADKDSYAAGDNAQLIIESDFSGPALLTFERGTTRREQLVELTAPVTLVEVTIQPDDAPNIYVTVNAWQEQDTTLTEDVWNSLADSNLRVASVNLSVPVTDKTLTITITPDKEVYAPREEATFTMRVTNWQGDPVSAELSLAMVDEAIFALSDELSGAIFDAFYYERDNIVRTYDALSPSRYLGGGMGGGGGDGDLTGNPRSDFPDTAEWFPVLHTDFNGEASVTITLPDSLTSWRLTAKAATADTQVGQIFTNILTQQEIVVRPILPRTLTAGDQVNLSALIHNYSQSTQTIAVQLTIDNSQLTTLRLYSGQVDNSDLVQTITLSPGAVQLVGWPVTAVAAAEAQIVVQAKIDDVVKDAVQLPLTIRPLAIPDVTTQVGQFRAELATTLDMPAAALPMSSVRLELSRSIAGTLLEGLEYLTGFPYGCVEQTMSRALPNAVVGRALFQLGVSNPTLQADLPAKVNAGLQRLYGYQHNDGGWGWWYDDSTHDYQTAWVIFGLGVMADAGYEVDSGVIERGVGWLNENLSDMDIRTRAYALYSMAVAGQPNLEATLALMGRLDELDTFSQAGLAMALYEVGEGAEAAAVVDYLVGTAVTSGDGKVYWAGENYDGAYYQKTMASSVRSTSLALSALAQIRPGHELEPGIVRWLMGQRQRQGWGTTNETSYAILGLTDHLLATSFSESAADTLYTVLLNGEAIASGSLGRGEPAVSLEIPAGQMAAGLNQLRITQDGSRPLYYVINSRVYLAQEKIGAAGGIEVERVYLDGETGEVVETAVPGQLIKVRLTVTLPENASYLIVEDNLPGGLDALNEKLNTSSHVAVAGGWGEPLYYWQEYGYNYKEIRGGRVSFFITEMDKGSRTFTYFTRATHAGEFVAMPAQVYAMYDLTTWGRSASGRLTVE